MNTSYEESEMVPLKKRDQGEVSDGYHTFDELYDHRNLIFINLCLATPHSCAWKEGYPGWPVLFAVFGKKQISYHVPEKFLYLFKDKIKRDENFQWDGHTSNDVLELWKKIASE